ncbi:MAG: hypothetical protein KF774_03830 [Planctomyces sp.]|nr:hypothetical protein [Planctomyces sp.]
MNKFDPGRRLACGLLLTVSCACGCDSPVAPPPAVRLEYSAVRMIDFLNVPAGMDPVLKDVFSGAIIGRSMDGYPDWQSADHTMETVGSTRVINVYLPILEPMRSRLQDDDGLSHAPTLSLRVNPQDNSIVTVYLMDMLF